MDKNYKRFTVRGISDKPECDVCGKTNLKMTVVIESESGESGNCFTTDRTALLAHFARTTKGSVFPSAGRPRSAWAGVRSAERVSLTCLPPDFSRSASRAGLSSAINQRRNSMPTIYANPMMSPQYEGCLLRMIAAGLKGRSAPAPFGGEKWIVRDARGKFVRFTMDRNNVRRMDVSSLSGAERAIVDVLVSINVLQIASR